MRPTKFALIALLAATPVLASGTDPVVVYPYASGENYCPEGLQPVTVDGTVSCGKPTTDVTYQRATAARGGSRTSGGNCPIGVKGC